MCPRRGYNGHVERWRYTFYKRQRRSVASGPYQCPSCGAETLIIKAGRKEKTVLARCGCGFKQDLKFVPSFEIIDYYNKAIDMFYKARK